jgi:hypothetical protein
MIVDRILALEKIGTTIEPLIRGAMEKKSTDDDVHLGPDYTVVVPQVVFKSEGTSFHVFVGNLMAYLQEKVVAKAS